MTISKVIPDGVITGGVIKEKLRQIPANFVSCSDYHKQIGEFLSPDALAFLEAGAADEITRDENISSFRDIQLAGRVLGNVRGGNLRTELFGHTLSHPIMLAPIGYQKLFHPRGELETALAARVTETPMVVSSLSNHTLEEIASIHQGILWFQLYYRNNVQENFDLIKRAADAGYSAIIITLDAPISGIRNREQRAGFAFPAELSAVNMPKSGEEIIVESGGDFVFDGLMRNAPDWDDIANIIKNSPLPVILKGILHPDDAQKAIEIGAQGIVVSNHGGRIIDTLPASINALPAIANAVQGRIKILLDGGIRRGSDVFKSIALGADAVMIGRPYVYGLAIAGALGAAHIVRTMTEELAITMAVSGTKAIKGINSSYLNI